MALYRKPQNIPTSKSPTCFRLGEKSSRKILKILSHKDTPAKGVVISLHKLGHIIRELFENNANADITIIYTDNDELSRLLWEGIGKADIAEKPPKIGDEFFYLVGLKGTGLRPSKSRGCGCVQMCNGWRYVWL